MKLAVFTGAGISANAGIPTYRAAGSSWVDQDLEKKSHANRYGNHLDELWDKHWGPLSAQMRVADPTHAHKAIAEFEKSNEVMVITQNVDDLHERAGSTNVKHLHGTMDIYCMRCKKETNADWWKGAPVCMRCASRKTRPSVVLFGEALNKKTYRACNDFIQMQADAVLVIGSSLNVHPAASLVMDALDRKKTVVINKDKPVFANFFTELHLADADEVIDDVLRSL